MEFLTLLLATLATAVLVSSMWTRWWLTSNPARYNDLQVAIVAQIHSTAVAGTC